MDIGGIVGGEDVIQRRLRYKIRASEHFGHDGGDIVKADPVPQVPRDGSLIGRIERTGKVPAPADGIEGWMNRCVQAGYQRMAKGDHVLFTTERTLDNVRELCNDDVLDGNMLCFSFVEFDEADRTVLFVAADFEDALDTPSTWFNHYLFTFINTSPDPAAIQTNV